MAAKRRREHLVYLEAAMGAAERAVDAFNGVWALYRHESTLLLLANAWELLSKAVLLAKKESIAKGKSDETISGEVAVHRLGTLKLLDQRQVETIGQVISLRNAACHSTLPEVPPEVMQHLLYYSLKFFRETVATNFPSHSRKLPENYLSAAFTPLTTYADKVQRAVAKVRSSGTDKQLVWLLERGIVFDGTSYLSKAAFEKLFKRTHKILPHLRLSQFIRSTDMVRIVPVEAPRNFTADISLRKGKAGTSALPVIVQKTDINEDYPFLTRELGSKVAKNQNWIARAVMVLGLKGDPRMHQAVKAGTSTYIHRYSQAALSRIQEKLALDPTFDSYH